VRRRADRGSGRDFFSKRRNQDRAMNSLQSERKEDNRAQPGSAHGGRLLREE
jgi:hypothetical protein